MRGKGERAPAKVSFGKRDKRPDSKRSTLRQQRALALWRGSKPVAGTPADGYLTAKKPTVGSDALAIRQRDSEPTQEPTAAATGAAASHDTGIASQQQALGAIAGRGARLA
jgi:hypothetical protein